MKINIQFQKVNDINKDKKNKRNLNSLVPMSSNQVPPPGENPPVHQISSKHNITLGLEQTQRKSFPNSNMGRPFSQNYAIQFQLKNISREVTRIAQKADRSKYLNHNSPITSSLPTYQDHAQINQIQKEQSSMINLKTNGSTLSKYNYYGRQYRFSTQNPSQTSQKPLDTNQPSYDQELNSFSPTTKYKPKKEELEVPDSKSYYIYFDQPKRQIQLKQKNTKVQSKHQIPQTNNSFPDKRKQALYGSLNIPKHTHLSHLQQDYDEQVRTPPLQVFSKQQPQSKWVLQKKVKTLEKELQMMKKKEEQRQKLRNFTTNNSKKDSKVFVGKQVDQLINSLWP